MTTGETTATVAVPVELLKRMHESIDALDYPNLKTAASNLIPKPSPRFVAVTAEQWDGDYSEEWFAAQPDLLTLLDEVVDSAAKDAVIRYPKTLMLRIRAALGVDE